MEVMLLPPGTPESEEGQWSWDLDRLQDEGREIDRVPPIDEPGLRAWIAHHEDLQLTPRHDSDGIQVLGDAGNVVMAFVWGDNDEGQFETWTFLAARDPWGDECHAVLRPCTPFDPDHISMSSYQYGSSNHWHFFGLDVIDKWEIVGLIQATDEMFPRDDPDDAEVEGMP